MLTPTTALLPLADLGFLTWGDEPDDFEEDPGAPQMPGAPAGPSGPGAEAVPAEEGPALPPMPIAPRQPEMEGAPGPEEEEHEAREERSGPSGTRPRVAGREGRAAGGAGAQGLDSEPSPPAGAGTVPSPRARQALDVARREIGVQESPRGSNRGPRVDVYQDGKGQFWCCHFVSWCFEQTGESPFGHIASVDALRRWAKVRGKYLPAKSVQPEAGDLFTMARTDKAGKVVGGHVGFVQSWDPRARTVRTIEGNISDRVGEMTRQIGSLDGVVRL